MEECYGLEALTILWFQLLQKIELHGVKIKIIKPPHRLIKKRPKSRTRWKINLSWFSRNVWSVTAMSAQCPFYPVVDVIKMFITLQADSLVAGYIWAEEMSPFCIFLLDSHSCGDLWWCVESWEIPWDCLSSFLSTESHARSAKNTVNTCKSALVGQLQRLWQRTDFGIVSARIGNFSCAPFSVATGGDFVLFS